MRARNCALVLVVWLIAMSAHVETARADRWLGGGIHYLRNLGDISGDDTLDLSQDSISILISAKNDFGLIKLDGQLEYIFDHVGSGEAMWQPAMWGLVGGLIYGGAGIGIGHVDGEWQSNPFYAFRAGVAFPLEKIEIDCYATYRFQSDQDLEGLTDEDLDSLTFAAVARFDI